MSFFEKSLTTLELPAVLELLAQQAVGETAKEPALTLTPSGDRAEVKRRLDETTAAKTMMVVRGSPSFSGVKDVRTITADMTRDSGEDGQRVTGEVSLQRQQGDESASKLTLVPDVTFLPEGDTLASGMVQVSQSVGSSLKEQADVRMEVRRSDWLSWELRPNVITVVMDNMAGISRRIVQGATVELVRRLVLLPTEDTAFLSAGLEPDVWQQIVEAAQSALQEEVIP